MLFVCACELKGYTDWIWNLDFSLPIGTDGEGNRTMLVSLSQDKGIRIWKMALKVQPMLRIYIGKRI
jgi:elongator complex protein 2